MNIIEAIKSGRPFRMTGKSMPWTMSAQKTDGFCNAMTGIGIQLYFTPMDIIGDDWEIQEPSVTITRSQFNKAYDAHTSRIYGYSFTDSDDNAPKNVLAKLLGL